MRRTIQTPFAAAMLTAMMTLSSCGTTAVGSKGESMTLDQVCAEQAEWARNGTTDGGQITITCP